jgi:hypothetical protein
MPNVLEELAASLAPILDKQKALQYGTGYKHDASGTPISVGYSHGPGGLLTFPGVDNSVFHTVMGNMSILGQIPATPSVDTNPTYFTVTGVQADTGNEMTDPCDNAPTAGLMKGCMLTSVFGRYERATPELEVNRIGQRNDRSDPMDLTLVGSPIAASGIFNRGASAPGDVFTNEVSRKFWELGVSFWRLLAQQLWQGTPANNSAGGGYKELTGLSTLVNTGHVDAETGAACAALDSYVGNFNHTRIDSADSDIVAAITNMYHQVFTRAEGMGMLPVRWVLAMRPQLFYELTSIWPCSYLSYRCAVSPGMVSPMQGVIDAQDAVAMRDAMRAGKYLMVDGQRIEVVLDHGIAELDGNSSGGNFPGGCFESDIYLLPMSVVGGRSVLFMNYFDFTNPSAQSAITNMWLGRTEGPFLTWPRQTNTCIVWQSKVEPRLVLRTPWLAARLQNVVYCPITQTREPFPADPYFVDGGKTSRPGPSYYSLWQS